MHAAVVRSFDHPPRYETFPTPAPRGEHEVLVDVARLRPASARALRGQRQPLHEHRRAAADPRHRRRRPHRVGRAPVLRPARHAARRDGRADARRPPPLRAAARRLGPGRDRRRHEPRHVRLDRPAQAHRLRARPAASSSSAPPAMPGSWPSRSPSTSGRVTCSPPAATPERLAAPTARRRRDGLASTTLGRGRATSTSSSTTCGARPPRTPCARSSPSARDRGRALDWIQIGSVAGPTAAIPSAALRAANLRIMGSGPGLGRHPRHRRRAPGPRRRDQRGHVHGQRHLRRAQRRRSDVERARRHGRAHRLHAVGDL